MQKSRNKFLFNEKRNTDYLNGSEKLEIKAKNIYLEILTPISSLLLIQTVIGLNATRKFVNYETG